MHIYLTGISIINLLIPLAQKIIMLSGVDTDFAKQNIPECHPLYSKFYKRDQYNCTFSRVQCRETVILSMLEPEKLTVHLQSYTAITWVVKYRKFLQ